MLQWQVCFVHLASAVLVVTVVFNQLECFISNTEIIAIHLQILQMVTCWLYHSFTDSWYGEAPSGQIYETWTLT